MSTTPLRDRLTPDRLRALGTGCGSAAIVIGVCLLPTGFGAVVFALLNSG